MGIGVRDYWKWNRKIYKKWTRLININIFPWENDSFLQGKSQYQWLHIIPIDMVPYNFRSVSHVHLDLYIQVLYFIKIQELLLIFLNQQ